MLKVDLNSKKLAPHHDSVEAYFNIYLNGLADEFRAHRFSLDLNTLSPAQTPLVEAEFTATPFYGQPIQVQSSASNPKLAIETCFARARRAIIRQRKLAALAS
jgi:hypothetical protein